MGSRWFVVKRKALAAIFLVGAVLAAPVTSAGASDDRDPLPRVPPGFGVAVVADIGGLATSIAPGPEGHLYVTDYASGRVLRISPGGGPASVFADGFRNPLGVTVAKNGVVFVADSEASRDGPFGSRVYGRVWRARDRDGDGIADTQSIVLKDLPNGRHNTNGLALGPDGMLYVANGNSTDDGIEGGAPEALPWSGAVVRVNPRATDVSLADLPRKKALVATGMRNLYDLTFSPFHRNALFIPTNGVDDARPAGEQGSGELENSDDLLYSADVADGRVEDFGFPSCLYNHERTDDKLRPYDNPHPEVIRTFGRCPKRSVPRPIATFGLHVSADGLEFQRTDAWGDDFRNDLFVAEFGNFFGDEVVGHKVVRVELDGKGKKVKRVSEFLSGATPLDLTFDDDGDMYVADFSGKVYRVFKIVDVPRTFEVTMSAYQFLPQAIVVPEGSTVRWVNEDVLGLPHNVTGQFATRADGRDVEPGVINSRDLAVGDAHTFRFESPGTYVYTCSISATHEALMHGTVIVAPAGS